MAANTRTAHQIEHDRAEIARRYLRGETQVAIAQALSMTRQMVGYDLRALHERWIASSLHDLTEHKARELAKIDQLELTYWEAWQASLDDREIAVQRQKGKDAPKDVMLRKEGQSGNPAFLAGVMSCIDRRCRLLGLDAPQKMEHRFTREQADALALDEIERELARRGWPA